MACNTPFLPCPGHPRSHPSSKERNIGFAFTPQFQLSVAIVLAIIFNLVTCLPSQLIEQVHCVRGTEGADFVSDLDIACIDLIIEKGQEKLVESYSAFEDPWGLFPSTLEQSLRDAGIKHVVVTGLGTLFLNFHFVIYFTLSFTSFGRLLHFAVGIDL
jgi:nicotinamidase-related amidase